MSDNPKPRSVPKRKPSDRFAFHVLDVFTARAYAALTATVYPPLLAERHVSHLAIGASLNGRAVGLALANQSDRSAHILSIYVRPEYRRRGVGIRLLEMLENRLTE